MKKQFFYAALAIALMSSCSKDNDPGTTNPEGPNNPEVIDDTTPAVIRLGIGSPTIVGTRGTGSVGDLATETATNIWNGQALSVLMFEKGGVKQVMDGGAYIFANETFRAPFKGDNASTGTIKFETGNVKYYPVSGQYDFYGYHVDADDVTQKTDVTDAYVVTATIDGTNDVMAAATYFTSADSVALINAALTKAGKSYQYEVVAKGTIATTESSTPSKSPITDNADDVTLLNAELAKAYSAYAARRGVQPNLLFKHMLSRLKFNVFAGEADAAETHTLSGNGATQGAAADPAATTGAAYIESISVTGVPIDGVEGADPTPVGIKDQITLTVAPTQSLTATTSSETAAFTLMEAVANDDTAPANNLQTLTATAPKAFSASDPQGTPVGESIMIVPGDEKIYLTVAIRQFVQTNDGTGTGGAEAEKWEWKTQTFSVPVSAPTSGDATTFEKGKSYNINITVYGFQKIKIDATLEGWISGGDIPVNPEDM